MSADLTKLIFTSEANAYKNVASYSGTITFPTSLTANQTSTNSVTFSLAEAPTFLKLYAKFTEYVDRLSGVSPQWYAAAAAGYYTVGINITTGVHAGVISCGLTVFVSGTTVTVQGILNNPYSDPITLESLAVPFVLVDYSLAN